MQIPYPYYQNIMQANITQRLAERLIHKKQAYSSRQNAKSINEELLEMVTHIRSLEDQLLAEQYRQELLCEQNQVYKSKLEKLNSRNDLQRQRITKLEEEYEVHKIKNNELQMCEDSLRSIYEEINGLTRVVESRAEECEILALQKRGIKEESDAFRQHNAELQEKQQHINNILLRLIRQFSNEEEPYQQDKPIATIKDILQRLKSELQNLQIESSRIQREGSTTVTLEKQAIIKLEFEYQLLKQRAKDEDKIQKLNEICASQSNLENVVEEMLVKQDQLIDKLNILEKQHAKIQKNYRSKLEKMNYDYQEELMKVQNIVKGLQIQKERIRMEIKQIDSKIQTKTQRYEQIFQEQEMSLKMDINLNSLKRLREVEERNKYLKLKINELSETKALLIQEKELLHSSI